jgi:LemA protein
MEPTLIVLLVLAAAAIIPAVWFIATFNALVRTRNHCRESWADIDTELRRRYDLIPNLVETVKGYAAHERETFEAVAQARAAAMASHGSPAEQAREENTLVAALNRIFAVVEAYPDLKASRNFLELQEELANTEDRIQRARRFYNANVRDMNNKVETVPSNLVANIFSFKREEFFEIEDAAVRHAPQVAL